jgi:16S rRNA C1402 (ribose-2'-O) methylase RsmI
MGIDIDLIPGPNSVLQALFFSGFEGNRGEFYFAGRIPQDNTLNFLNNIKSLDCPIIFICIPFLDKYIDDIATVFPDRDLAVCCDISKPTQKILRGKSKEMKEILEKHRKFPFHFDIINGWKTNILMFYSYYTLVISQSK